jgi:hypothetical protein
MQQETSRPNWAEITANAHRDQRFCSFGVYCAYGEVDGFRVGIVYATMSAGFTTFALNKNSLDRLRAGKETGKVDVAFVAAHRVNGAQRTYCGHMTVEEACGKLDLFHMEPRMGRYGEFFVLPLGFFPEDENAPF